MKRPSAPLVISLVALFFSLAGFGFAAGSGTPAAVLYPGKPVTAIAAGNSHGIAAPSDAVANCPKGEHAISGGWTSGDTTTDVVTITSNLPTRGDRGWVVIAKDESRGASATNYLYEAIAQCE
jgi:hypothetical protein